MEVYTTPPPAPLLPCQLVLEKARREIIQLNQLQPRKRFYSTIINGAEFPPLLAQKRRYRRLHSLLKPVLIRYSLEISLRFPYNQRMNPPRKLAQKFINPKSYPLYLTVRPCKYRFQNKPSPLKSSWNPSEDQTFEMAELIPIIAPPTLAPRPLLYPSHTALPLGKTSVLYRTTSTPALPRSLTSRFKRPCSTSINVSPEKIVKLKNFLTGGSRNEKDQVVEIWNTSRQEDSLIF